MPYVVSVTCPEPIDPARFAAVWDDFPIRTVPTTTHEFQACAALPDPSDPEGTSLRVLNDGTVRCAGAMFACSYPTAVSEAAAGEPWFSATFSDIEQRTLQLSASYSNPHALRNIRAMMVEARTIAERLGGRALDFDQAPLDDARIEAVTSGPRSRTLIGAAVERLDRKVMQEPYARLELPVGTNDVVSDYLLTHVRPWKRATLDTVRAVLESAEIGPVTSSATQLVVSFADPPPVAAALKLPPHALGVMLRDDGVLQLRAGGFHAFRDHVDPLLRCTQLLHEAFGGDVLLAGHPREELEADLQAARASGLGVDLFLAIARRGELVWRPRA